jgi:16S rRNA (guanine527-N7)-methyltransferase
MSSGPRAAPPDPDRGARPLGPEGFAAATGVSRETLARFERYAALLAKWNRTINLVGRGALSDPWLRHFLDSAQLLPRLPPAPEGRARVLVDLGSGAGFPGLVLAILGAGKVHLVEADQKKVAFLREVARETGTDVALHAMRIENLTPFPADVVTARALAPLPKLLGLAEGFLQPTQACPSPVGLFLKGRQVEQELTDAAQSWHMQTEMFPSRTDPAGRIVRLSRLARKGPPP